MSITASSTLQSAGTMVPVRIAALCTPAAIHVDLYLGSGVAADAPRLYSRAATPPSERDLRALQNSGVSTLYTTQSEAESVHEQFVELLRSEQELPAEVHFEIAREVAKPHFATAWNGAAAGQIVSQAAAFVDNILDVCDRKPNDSELIRSLLKHDGDTFTHISNVCLYTLVLLQRLGVSNPRQLSLLGQAALLHDVGKRKITKDILKKPSRLSPEERQAIAEHPRLGFEELCDRPDLDRDQLLMVYHHHEKIDGSGYPVGLQGEEIHWTGRLCAVVDVFDALTGRRPYRTPFTIEAAAAFLEQQVNQHFDEEFVRCWSSILCNQHR